MDIRKIRECFRYDADMGALFWRDGHGGRMSGKRAGSRQKNGYRKVNVGGKLMWEHRVIWAHATGEAPVGNIDHIDGNCENNRIENLRLCNQSQNAANSKLRSTNKSGETGVWFRDDTMKYVAYIQFNGKRKVLGCFANRDDAVSARKAAAMAAHGEFYRGTHDNR